MIPQLFVESIDLGDGRNITIETGRLAKQADGAVVVRIGKTVILGTVVSSRKASPGIDFLPLTVDYREKFASPYKAAEHGYIDEIIFPKNTRYKLIEALEMTQNKRASNPPKKHGNIPL